MAADVLYLPLITRLYPDTPWIFCYRDPIEILASQKKEGSIDLLPGQIEPALLGLEGDIYGIDPIVYQAHVLAMFGKAALDAHGSGKGLVLDYAQLPDALWTKAPAHFGFGLDADEQAAMRAVASRDAKRPDKPFVPDRESKQETGAAWRETVEAVAGPVMRALAAASSG